MTGYNSLRSLPVAMSISPLLRPPIMDPNIIEVEDGSGGVNLVYIEPVQRRPRIRQSSTSSGEPWSSMGTGLNEDLTAAMTSTTSSSESCRQIITRTMKKAVTESMKEAVTESIVTPIVVKRNFTAFRVNLQQNFTMESVHQRILDLNQIISSINYEPAMNFLSFLYNLACMWVGGQEQLFDTGFDMIFGTRSTILRSIAQHFHRELLRNNRVQFNWN